MFKSQEFQKALEAGRVEFAPPAERALANLDISNPDKTLTSVSVRFWGPFERDGKPVNGGGLGIDWESVSAGCGRCDFYIKDGKLRCYNQCEPKEFILKLLQRMLEDTELDDSWDNHPPVEGENSQES
jgi:hypothetical protein